MNTKDQIYPVYFLYGPEDYLIEEEIKRLLNLTLLPKERSLNLHLFSGEEHSPREIIQTARTWPMFSSYRYILVREMDQFKEDSAEKFLEYLLDPSPKTCLVMSGSTLGVWKKFQKELEKTCKFIEFQRLRGKELNLWLKKRAKEKGKILTDEAAQYLIELSGDHLLDLDQELEKVLLSIGEKEQIDLSDVEEITSEVKISTVFDLTDAIGQRDLEKALKIIEKSLESKSIPFRKDEEEPKKRDEMVSLLLLSMMAKQYWNLLKVKEMTPLEKEVREIAKKINMPLWNVRKLVEQSKQFSKSALQKGILRCYQTDLDLKRGLGTKNLLMEKLVIDLCRPQ